MSTVVLMDQFYHIYGRSRVLFQVKVAGADVGVEAVAAGAGFLEGAEEAILVFTERTGVNVTGADRSIDVRIIGRIADFDVEIAGVHFDIFVAGDAFDVQIPERQANNEIRGFGDRNDDARAFL